MTLGQRDTDNAPGTTMLLTLPTSSRTLRRISFAANTILLCMAMEYVTKVSILFVLIYPDLFILPLATLSTSQ
jgi:hypothetical protein